MIAFTLGYITGAADDPEQNVQTRKVVSSDPEWYFPGECHDAITFGVLTQFTNSERVEQYKELAAKCFDTVEMEIGEYEAPHVLPNPTTTIVTVSEEEDELTNEEIEAQIDDAWLECLDEGWSEYYCEDNYEDWLEG